VAKEKIMAKGKFPFALFEKSKADKEGKGMKEGSKAEEKADKKQRFARGGGVELRGKTKGTMITMKKGGKC
jgi:hypothetical protein